MTLTSYLPPVAENGSLLVDGGYMNVMPSDVMKYQMGARLVIAVDVSPESERDYFDYGTSLSGWWLLFNSDPIGGIIIQFQAQQRILTS